MKILQMFITIPKFNGHNFVEWKISLNDIKNIVWLILPTITAGLENPHPVFEEIEISSGRSSDGVEKPSEGDGNNTDYFGKFETTDTDIRW